MTAITGPALAQTQRDVPAVLEPKEAVLFSAGVDVVDVTAAVQDLDNRFVTDLGKDDFVLYEDGVPQEIRYFGRHTDVSMNLGLLVDTSGSQILLLEEQRNAGALFFRSLLRPDSDRAFVMTFDKEVALLQDFTSSVEKLEAGLALMAPPASQGAQRSGRRIRPTSTALYDAVYLAGDELFRRRDGRKVAVIISDGHDFGSIKSLDQAIQAAQKADLIVFAILYVAPSFAASAYSDPRAGKRMLSRLAGETGGRIFEVEPDLDLEAVFEAIDTEVRSQYSIGYTPKRDLRLPGFRTIKLECRRSGLVVRARNGYSPMASR